MAKKGITRNELELVILLSLFQATVEQQSTQIGKHQHQTKEIFNNWIEQGNELLESIQKNVVKEEMLNTISDVIQDAVNEIRKSAKVIEDGV